ncbi:hypothetical protein [Halomonas sp. BC04]|uniref:hypothetical protein n=1 Tax=Halomonas sp. BC04 TaxID=1403540 RepID=UPI001E47E96F|nr:hypothetical protein [Halomonas sp. BC04]
MFLLAAVSLAAGITLLNDPGSGWQAYLGLVLGVVAGGLLALTGMASVYHANAAALEAQGIKALLPATRDYLSLRRMAHA